MAVNMISSVGNVAGAAPVKAVEPASGADFKKMLFNEIEKVNQAQDDAKVATDAAISGTADSIHEMKVATMKAELTLEFAVSVNNKAIEAYKELMRLQL